ncbi:MAG TPA: hypothetical protein VMA34_10575 [Terracidiphilus sp.]|nr:hypothetical protein [Terracidiphilus sp.]
MGWKIHSAVAALLVSGMAPGAVAQKPVPIPPSGGAGSQSYARITAQPPSLTVSFAGKHEQWTAAALAALPHIAVKVYNGHDKATETYSGVPVIDLLTRVGVPDKPRGHQFRIYLVAEGADGYQVVFSLGEVAPDVHQGAVIVADRMDGKPLATDGSFKIVSTGEKRPARWVHNLVAIRVYTAE